MNLDIFIKIKPNNIKDKFLEVTEKFLKEKNRRYFGIAAASLQNQLDDPKYESYKPNSKIINIGISGEKTTSKVLREWIADKPECVLIDSISLPINNLEPEEDGEEGQLDLGDTDHLLIIGDNLIIIDSKNWKAKTTYQITEEKEILRGKKSFKGNRPRIQQCRELWRVGYKLVNQSTLIYFLDKLYNEKINNSDSKKFIRTELVALALTGLVKPYDKYKEKFGNVYNLAKGKS